MNPKFRATSLEILLFLSVLIMLFKTGVITDVTIPLTQTILVLSAAEAVRVLLKLRRLRQGGIDIDDQGLRSPLLYAVSPHVADLDYKFHRTLRPLYWACAIVFVAFALITILVLILYLTNQ